MNGNKSDVLVVILLVQNRSVVFWQNDKRENRHQSALCDMSADGAAIIYSCAVLTAFHDMLTVAVIKHGSAFLCYV
jgi:hypothetical protein